MRYDVCVRVCEMKNSILYFYRGTNARRDETAASGSRTFALYNNNIIPR